MSTTAPWHAGEVQLQTRAGVAERMQEIGRRVIRDHLPEQHRAFYRQLPFVLLGSVAADGRPWASLLEGPEGFAHSPEPHLLRLDALPAADDPAAAALQEGAALGLLGIELHSRRRNRLNGRILQRDDGGLSIAVEQAFGNCPRYIQQRQYRRLPATPAPTPAEHRDGLDEAARAAIRAADSFFVASYAHPVEGPPAVDVSHRGGPAGFVRVEGDRLSIPDFAGNLHFNTLGNLLLNPRAGLLFVDFASGDLLQFSGRTELTLEGEAIASFPGAERLWHLQVERMIRRPAALGLRWAFLAWSPHSLATTSAHAR